MADELPQDIVQSIAISNAKSIGEQPAILANLALAGEIFNLNMQQQAQIAQQQAMNQIAVATAATTIPHQNAGNTDGSTDALAKIFELMQDVLKHKDSTNDNSDEKSDIDNSTKPSENKNK
ncbi:hypothetical protein [Aliikangiella marina]|uniref:hypothetical protein n=1 Tax=Aliikangiella marina TaxID=1712262 RepID=UPI001AEEC780|nr:hypothetical protein [Aliikangiella marina]